jgi:energy-coupling factor transporter ATP-binding protein EcfA2
MPEHDCLPPDVSATELVVHMARMSGLPRAAARERTADTLRHVGLYEERYRSIGGYSTGMKQRVKLAQALVHDPQLVLLDEPTNGLDPAGRDDMLGLIRRIGTEFGISVLVASHLLGELERVCDHVVVIDAGTAAPVVVHRRRDRRQPADRGRGDRAHRRPGRGPTTGRARSRDRGPLLEVDLRDDMTYDVVRDAVVRLGVGWCGWNAVGTGWPRSSRRPTGVSMSTPAEPRAAAGRPGQGVIHDLGYRHYDGVRLGRAAIARALFVESAKGAYGLGRSTRSKVMPLLLLAAICFPALIMAVIAAVTAADKLPGDYTAYVLQSPARGDGLRRRAGPGLGLEGPAVPGDVALPVPPAGADRLRGGQVRGAHGGDLLPDGTAADDPVRRCAAGQAAGG